MSAVQLPGTQILQWDRPKGLSFQKALLQSHNNPLQDFSEEARSSGFPLDTVGWNPVSDHMY